MSMFGSICRTSLCFPSGRPSYTLQLYTLISRFHSQCQDLIRHTPLEELAWA